MKQLFLLAFVLMSSVLYCNAQNKIKNSPFVNVPISVSLTPTTKKLPKKENINTGDYLPIDFGLKVEFVRLPSDETAAFFTAQVENKELYFSDANQRKSSIVQVFGRITSLDKKIDGTFEDKIIFMVKDTYINNEKQSYVKGIILPPNVYKIRFMLRDSLTGKTGEIKVVDFTVPKL